MHRILVPVDGSKHSIKALTIACDLERFEFTPGHILLR